MGLILMESLTYIHMY